MFDRLYKKYFINNNKLDLSYNGLMNQNEIYEILNDENIIKNNDLIKSERKILNPFLYLFGNYDNIRELLKTTDINIFEFIYLNKYKIHKILYDMDSNIFVDSDLIKEFSDYYYLYLLIKEQPEMINYKYDFQLIKGANFMLISAKSWIQKIICAIMLLSFIYNYEDGMNVESKYEKDISNLKNECSKVINENKKYLEKYKIKLDIDNIVDNGASIIDIYCDIIITLINNKQLDASNETLNLLNEMKIKELRLNKQLFDVLKEVLDEKNLSNYEINDYEDFFDGKKIIFYFILFEYILKSSDYIFHIPFLLKTRNKIIEIIKGNHHLLISDLKKNKNDSSIDRLQRVLEYFIETDYYLQKKIKNPKNNKEALNDSNLNNSINRDSYNSNMSPNNNKDEQISYSAFNSSQENSSYRAFDASSYKQRSEQKSFGYYYQSDPNQLEESKEKANLIFSDSVFKLKVRCDKNKEEVIIEYMNISFKNEENKDEIISIDKVKEKRNINGNYLKFVEYIDLVEKELKNRYNKEEETEITLKFKRINESNDYYNIRCDLMTNNSQTAEKEFLDEDLFCNTNHSGLSCMVDAILGE